ncbi:protein phosphatase 2C domain-containing protein [Gilliamella sp. B2776]|uniref:PP2C family protein-serine/threonine phosphatase n=1 Tax=unclassified Gilliamella TaxID=2685620 RepID=UPI00226AE62E|nr:MULTISPECIES: protein phosphatase 2C domain-containing protein [unclassified Gilliamella]MCX8649964.1 protein phosphatase 2C domain-containing protein [Gilliamella sp. B2779]MCX8653896.1 protein phosphatase 2C domain-containing protein [Gilliamella sp. B2737]MCX8665950.1 protein phosphatase 2C domain-containing protein [Gilliamella sp. B2887]MCX8691737.1 protein phosphatase 2C domain-containing protein [Gilliamella sp. B2776]MCX8698274.1 protein phosphatase 2C domain-containing protein [Gil
MFNLISSCSFSYPKNTNRVNEDSVLYPIKIGNGYLFAIADGVGSYQGADKASKAVINSLQQAFEVNIKNIDELFKLLKDKVSEISLDPQLVKAATTLTFGYFDHLGLTIGHIGDCRLYTKYGNKLKQLTTDHTQHQKLLEEKIYTKKELKEIGGKNILTTAISKHVDMLFDKVFIPISDLPIDNNKLLLFIMSDGTHFFWEKNPRFSEKTMNSAIKFTNSLLRRIERNNPIDDYSLVAVEFQIN